jgi:tetratricopeptide (TPR) repeat protein
MACAAATPQILAALVDKSMLAYDWVHDRYTCHELVRQLAEEHLQESGQATAVYHKHAGHFCALACGAWSQVETDYCYDFYYQVIGFELDNCRAAQQRSLAAGEVETALQLAAALSEYLADYGMAEEALRSLEEALAAGGERCAPATRAAAYLRVADIWLDYRGGREKPIEFAQKGLALYQALADQDGVVRALHTCGYMFIAYDWDRSRDYLTQSVEACERAGIESPSSLGTLTVLEIFTGNFEAALMLNARRRAICEKQGLKEGVAAADTSMAFIYYYQERLEEAQALAEKSLETQRAQGSSHHREVEVLARISLKQHRLDRAWALLREWLQIIVNGNFFSQAMFCLGPVAEWFYHTGHPQRAAFWIGGHDQAREWFVQPVEPVRLPHYQWLVAATRDALGEEAYAAAWQKGFAIPVEEALPLALQALEQTPITPAGLSPGD